MQLSPFTPYMSQPTPESRRKITRQIMETSEKTTEQIIDGLIQIIAMEGPLLSTRAFNLYSKKGGMAKLTNLAKLRFTKALMQARSDGKLLMEQDPSHKGQVALLWLPSMERVITRELGNRGFDDIPASELGEVMFELFAETEADKPELYQKMTELYGLKQLPKKAMARLDMVFDEYIS